MELNALNSEAPGGSMVFGAGNHTKFPPSTNYSRFPTSSPKPTVGNTGRNVTGVKRQNSYYCTHCKMNGHSIERCWKIHGFPEGPTSNTWRRNTSIHANIAHSSEVEQPTENVVEEEKFNAQLTTSQYQQPMQMMANDQDANTLTDSTIP